MYARQSRQRTASEHRSKQRRQEETDMSHHATFSLRRSVTAYSWSDPVGASSNPHARTRA